MKFSKRVTFERHLEEAFPDHLSSTFLISIPADDERRVVIANIVKLLKKKDPLLRVVQLVGVESCYEEIKKELQTITLWGGMSIVVCDLFDKVYLSHLKNRGCPHLFSLVPKGAHLILGAAFFKAVVDFYQDGKKEVVALDLNDEKPWEKEKRIEGWVIEKVKERKKNMNPEVSAFLIKGLGTDFFVLEQEIEKLLCYVGEKKDIGMTDVEIVCSIKDRSTGWQLAEQVAWEGALFLKHEDLNLIISLIGQIRYHLQLGYQMSELIEKNGGFNPSIRSYFPQLRGHQFDRFIMIASKRGRFFYKQALQALYEFESAAKSSSLKVGLFFDLFQARMYTEAT